MDAGMVALIISCLTLLLVLGVVGIYLSKRKETKELPAAKKDICVVDDNKDTENIGNVGLSEVLLDAVSIEMISEEDENKSLVFNRIKEPEKKNYREIIVNESSRIGGFGAKVASTVGQQVFSMQQLATQAPNGLFTATTNPEVLTRFADGTVSTMVHGEKGIVANFGYKQVQGISMFNPAMIVNMGMQGMAFISGQYYLKRINSGIEKIGSKVDELLEFQKAEKVGDLKHAWDTLKKLSSREIADSQDIDRIVRIVDDSGKVFEQYRLLAKQKLSAIKRFTGKSSTAEAKLEEYRQKLLDLQECLEICFIAEQVKLKAEMAEIIIRQRVNPRDPKIDELKDEFRIDVENSYSCETCECFDEFSDPILKRAELMSSHHRGLMKAIKSLFRGADTVSDELMEPIRNVMDDMEGSFNTLVEREIYRKVLASGKEEQKMLLMPGTDDQELRVFIEVTDEGLVN